MSFLAEIFAYIASTMTNTPIKVTVLVLPGSTLMTFSSVIDPMRAANRLAGQPLFKWELVSFDGMAVRLTGGISVPVDNKLNDETAGDCLIVVASFDHEKHATRQSLLTLKSARRRFATIYGVEAGTWLLARAGILKDERVTTHWEDLDALQEEYPDLEVCADRCVTDDRIITCGGASPAFDMMLDLIETHGTTLLAHEVAAVFSYEQLHVPTDPQPRAPLSRSLRSDPRLNKAVKIMEANLDEPWTLKRLAETMGVSSRTLHDLFVGSMGVSPGAYGLNLRLQAARKMVSDTSRSMQDIGERCGFSSLSTFSRAFRKRYGISPKQMRLNAKSS